MQNLTKAILLQMPGVKSALSARFTIPEKILN